MTSHYKISQTTGKPLHKQNLQAHLYEYIPRIWESLAHESMSNAYFCTEYYKTHLLNSEAHNVT